MPSIMPSIMPNVIPNTLYVQGFSTNVNVYTPSVYPINAYTTNACTTNAYTTNAYNKRKTKTLLHSSQFSELTSSLTSSFSTLSSTTKLTPSNTKTALDKVRKALVSSDVNLGVVDELIENVNKKVIGTEVTKGVTGEEFFIKLFYDELVLLMGGDPTQEDTDDYMGGSGLKYNGKSGRPSVVVMAGLQGAGKTTFTSKLGRWMQEEEIDRDKVDGMDVEERRNTLRTRLPRHNRSVICAPCDVHRPAATEQLRVMCSKAGVKVYQPKEEEEGDAVKIAEGCVREAEKEGYDTVLIDTAGRQTVNEGLMEELREINRKVKPDEVLLVVDAMTGQEAADTTKSFDLAVGLTGAVLTKTDGDSKGGAAVSIKAVSGKDIKFMGTGEGVKDIDAFFPKRMASRILGMGDVISLVEKASAEVSDADAMKMADKMKEATFDFDDFMKQSRLVSKMGNFAGVAKMIPGMAGKIDDKMLRTAEDRLKKSEAMIQSMTRKEKANPDLLITDRSARSRLERIAKGSGNEFNDAMGFVGEFQKMKTMMSRMQKQMAGEDMDEEEASKAMMAGGQGAMGNRAQRRMAKKSKKTGRGGGGGFG